MISSSQYSSLLCGRIQKTCVVFVMGALLLSCSSTTEEGNTTRSDLDAIYEEQARLAVSAFMKYCWATLDNHATAKSLLVADGFAESTPANSSNQKFEKNQVVISLWGKSDSNKKKDSCSAKSRAGSVSKVQAFLLEEMNNRGENYKLYTSGKTPGVRFPSRLKSILMGIGYLSVQNCPIQREGYFLCP